LKSIFWGSASWLLSGAVIQAAVAFVANLFLMRMLLPEDFGRYAIIQANLGLISAFLNFRIADVVLRLPESEYDESVVGTLAGALFLQTILVGVLGLLSIYFMGYLSVEALILVATILGASWTGFFIRIYERKFNYRGVTLTENGSAILSNIAAVCGAVLGLGAIVLYFRDLLRVLLQFLALLYFGAVKFQQVKLPNSKSFAFLKTNISGIWVDGILEQTFHRVIILAVGFLAGEKGAGYFFQARRLAMVPHELTQPLTFRLAYNYFSHKVSPLEKYAKLMQFLRYELVFLTLAVLCILFILDPVVPWLFGANWEPVVEVMYYLGGFMIFVTLFNTIKSYSMAENQLGPFIVYGRSFQFVGLAIGLALGCSGLMNSVNGLAMGLSVSYVLSSAVLVGYYIFQNGKAEH